MALDIQNPEHLQIAREFMATYFNVEFLELYPQKGLGVLLGAFVGKVEDVQKNFPFLLDPASKDSKNCAWMIEEQATKNRWIRAEERNQLLLTLGRGHPELRRRLHAVLESIAISRFFNGARHGDAVRHVICSMNYDKREKYFFVDFLCHHQEFIQLIRAMCQPSRAVDKTVEELQRILPNVLGVDNCVDEGRLLSYIEYRRRPENRTANAR